MIARKRKFWIDLFLMKVLKGRRPSFSSMAAYELAFLHVFLVQSAEVEYKKCQ